MCVASRFLEGFQQRICGIAVHSVGVFQYHDLAHAKAGGHDKVCQLTNLIDLDLARDRLSINTDPAQVGMRVVLFIGVAALLKQLSDPMSNQPLLAPAGGAVHQQRMRQAVLIAPTAQCTLVRLQPRQLTIGVRLLGRAGRHVRRLATAARVSARTVSSGRPPSSTRTRCGSLMALAR